jgi:hypothetical protein
MPIPNTRSIRQVTLDLTTTEAPAFIRRQRLLSIPPSRLILGVLNAAFAGRSRISAHPPFRPYNNPIHRHTGTLSAAEMMAQPA